MKTAISGTLASMTQQERIREIQERLTAWYRRCRRKMPWRGRKDPYAVWVSEIMLQQTQVKTVGPYYERFLKRFPDVKQLAKARPDDVLKAWEGLGYYSRARNLHRAAKRIGADHAGRLPKTVPELLDLPGIGRYTAGAIASIAFGLDEPVLDGNVTRVFCRLFRIRENPKKAETHRKLWTLARKSIPAGRAGVFNQALMDLGATVCIPRRPRCEDCPLANLCRARAKGDQYRLPARSPAKPLPHYDVAAGVIRKKGRLLIDRRNPEGLLGGLWEFPGGQCEPGESPAEALVREVREELSIEIRVLNPLMTIKHAYTHFRITLHAFECEYVSGRPTRHQIGCSAFRWILPSELSRFAFPKANHKIIALLHQEVDIRPRKNC